MLLINTTVISSSDQTPTFFTRKLQTRSASIIFIKKRIKVAGGEEETPAQVKRPEWSNQDEECCLAHCGNNTVVISVFFWEHEQRNQMDI